MAQERKDISREQLAGFLRSKLFEVSITTLIIINAIILGLETVPSINRSYGPFLEFANNLILTIFIIELASKMYAFGPSFWRDGWSWFDMFVVGIALIPAEGAFSALRTLRALRILRLITVVPSLRIVVEGLIRAIPGLGSILLLLLLLLYVYAVMGTKLFGATSPEMFGSLPDSAFTLFTVMTLEGWPDVARTVMSQHEWAWLFFISYIMLSSFAVLNLFIGVIVDAMQTSAARNTSRLEEFVDREQDEIMVELRKLRSELSELRQAVQAKKP